jgi:hypothetical protein
MRTRLVECDICHNKAVKLAVVRYNDNVLYVHRKCWDTCLADKTLRKKVKKEMGEET